MQTGRYLPSGRERRCLSLGASNRTQGRVPPCLSAAEMMASRGHTFGVVGKREQNRDNKVALQ